MQLAQMLRMNLPANLSMMLFGLCRITGRYPQIIFASGPEKNLPAGILGQHESITASGANARRLLASGRQSHDLQRVEISIERAGSMRALARMLGITHQAIRLWDKVPAERLLEIEEKTGIARERLRPEHGDLGEGAP
jgi:hypothetical protein